MWDRALRGPRAYVVLVGVIVLAVAVSMGSLAVLPSWAWYAELALAAFAVWVIGIRAEHRSRAVFLVLALGWAVFAALSAGSR